MGLADNVSAFVTNEVAVNGNWVDKTLFVDEKVMTWYLRYYNVHIVWFLSFM